MKNLFLIILCSLFSAFAWSQVSFKPSITHITQADSVITDTLGFNFFTSNTWGVLKYSPAGYVFGNNIYNDKAKTQVYKVDAPHQIHQVLVGFALKCFNSSDSASHVSLRLYNMDKTGFTTNGIQACPGSYFYNKDIPVFSIDTANIMVFNVDSFAQSVGDFGVGIDFSGLNTLDTVVLLSTNSGTSIRAQTSWETSSQNQNYTILNSWGFESTPALFPVATPATSSAISIFNQFNIRQSANMVSVFVSNKGYYELNELSGKKLATGKLEKGENIIFLNENFLKGMLIFKIFNSNSQILGSKKLIFDGIK